MRTFKIRVNENHSEIIERLEFEINGLQNIVNRYLDKHIGDKDDTAVSAPCFQYFLNEITSKQMEYEMAKANFEKLYIPQEFLGHSYNWELDYQSCILTISLLCECDVDYNG